jgi:hypothetical protein
MARHRAENRRSFQYGIVFLVIVSSRFFVCSMDLPVSPGVWVVWLIGHHD